MYGFSHQFSFLIYLLIFPSTATTIETIYENFLDEFICVVRESWKKLKSTKDISRIPNEDFNFKKETQEKFSGNSLLIFVGRILYFLEFSAFLSYTTWKVFR